MCFVVLGFLGSTLVILFGMVWSAKDSTAAVSLLFREMPQLLFAESFTIRSCPLILCICMLSNAFPLHMHASP